MAAASIWLVIPMFTRCTAGSGYPCTRFGIGYLTAMDFTIFMVRQPPVLYYSIAAVVLFSAAAGAIRYVFDDFGFYVWFAILFLIVAFSAGYAGSLTGNKYANRIMTVDDQGRRGGRLAYCVLKEKAEIPEEIKYEFQEMTTDERVRMIKQAEDRVFLYILPSPAPTEVPDHGDHITIPMEAISFLPCF